MAKVPMEYIGRARAFRARIIDADKEFQERAEGPIHQKFCARLATRPTLRKPETLDLFRQWQTTSTFAHPPFKHSYAKLHYTKRRVEIFDFRLVAVDERNIEWDEDERESGIHLITVRMIAQTGSVHTETKPICSFSLHAMARYYQKAFRATDNGLIGAIWGVLWQALPYLKDPEADWFTLEVPHGGGNWWGRMMNIILTGPDLAEPDDDEEVENHYMLGVKTFFTNDERAARLTQTQ